MYTFTYTCLKKCIYTYVNKSIGMRTFKYQCIYIGYMFLYTYIKIFI